MGAPSNPMGHSYGTGSNMPAYAGPMGSNPQSAYSYQNTNAPFAYQGVPMMQPLYNPRGSTPPPRGPSPYAHQGVFSSAAPLPLFVPPRLHPEHARRGPYPGPQQTQDQRVPANAPSGPRMRQVPSYKSLKASRQPSAETLAKEPAKKLAVSPFGDEDFPSLSSQSAGKHDGGKKQETSDADDLANQLAAQTLGGGKQKSKSKPKYIKYNAFDPRTGNSQSVAAPPRAAAPDPSKASDTSTSTSTTTTRNHRGFPGLPPPIRQNRNTIFALDLATVRPGQIVYIDAHPSISYSGHPALITKINRSTRTLTFYKKCSFHSIGGFPQKYAAYRNPHARAWQERGWLLVEDVAGTGAHLDTPVLRLAEGKKMPGASYVDVSGPRRLGLEYFSRFSVGRRFPELWLEEESLRRLEDYARWYRGANPYPNPQRVEEEEDWGDEEEEGEKGEGEKGEGEKGEGV